MKKTLMIIALVCLAVSSAFAVTITDWQCLSDDVISDYYSDLNPSGFAVDVPETLGEEMTVVGRVAFESYGVSDWLFNSNLPITVRVTGFDKVIEQIIELRAIRSNSRGIFTGTKGLDVGVLVGNSGIVTYSIPISGNGIYELTAEDIASTDFNPGAASRLSDLDGIGVSAVYAAIKDYDIPFATLYAVPGTKGSVEFFPKDETEVPEPATCAYGALGLVSILGMKRRIRK